MQQQERQSMQPCCCCWLLLRAKPVPAVRATQASPNVDDELPMSLPKLRIRKGRLHPKPYQGALQREAAAGSSCCPRMFSGRQ